MRQVRDLVVPACEHNDNVLAPLKPASMLALVQDREVSVVDFIIHSQDC